MAGVEGSSVLLLLGIPPAGRPGSLHLAPSYLNFQPLHSAVPPRRWMTGARGEGRTRRGQPAGWPLGWPAKRGGSELIESESVSIATAA